MCALVTQHSVPVVGSPLKDSNVVDMDIALTEQTLIMEQFHSHRGELVRLVAEMLDHAEPAKDDSNEHDRSILEANEYKKRVSFDEEPVILNVHDTTELFEDFDVDCIQPGRRQSHCINLIEPIKTAERVLSKPELKRRNSLLKHLLHRFAKS